MGENDQPDATVGAPMDATVVKAFFDQVASDWDTMRLTYYDERVIEQLAAQTRLTGEQTVVDVGTGTGFVAAGLAAHTPGVSSGTTTHRRCSCRAREPRPPRRRQRRARRRRRRQPAASR